MPFTRANGIDVYYEVHGEGPRLLHFGGTGGDLRKEPSIFASPLPRHFELLAHDQRGLGQTGRPDLPYAMADYAADADALLEAVGWDACHVMGASFGGMVAQEFAIRYPHRVQKLVLCCTSSGGAGGSSYPVHALALLDPDERARRYITLADRRHDEAWMRSHRDEYRAIVTLLAKNEAVGAGEPNRAVGAKRQLEARMQHDTYDRLARIQAPTLVCAGTYDDIAPLANSEVLQTQIPDAAIEVFDGGHRFLVQDRRAFPRIVAFLSA